jgi:uncharacterized protein YndB with AHSA1/START domain
MSKAKVTANPGESIIYIEREFNSPREKVFKAMTTKELIEKWWIGPGYEVRVDELDVREGGKWKYIQVMKDGSEIAFFGTYHEVAAPERVVQTFEFSGMPERGHVAMEKMELSDVGNGKTKMVVTSTLFSVADRDGMIASGMEEGMQNTYNALDAVLAEM